MTIKKNIHISNSPGNQYPRNKEVANSCKDRVESDIVGVDHTMKCVFVLRLTFSHPMQASCDGVLVHPLEDFGRLYHRPCSLPLVPNPVHFPSYGVFARIEYPVLSVHPRLAWQ